MENSKYISEETIKKNTPISHRKADFYNALIGIFHLITTTCVLRGELERIASAIRDFSENGSHLPNAPFNGDSALGMVAKARMPRHRRKIALFTNLVRFAQLSAYNLSEDYEGEKDFSTDDAEMQETITKVFAAFSGLIANDLQRVVSEDTDSEYTDNEQNDANSESEDDDEGSEWVTKKVTITGRVCLRAREIGLLHLKITNTLGSEGIDVEKINTEDIPE